MRVRKIPTVTLTNINKTLSNNNRSAFATGWINRRK